jgi:hypothetical protein
VSVGFQSASSVVIISDVTFEWEFGSGKQTYRGIRLSLCGKAAGGGPLKLVVASPTPGGAGIRWRSGYYRTTEFSPLIYVFTNPYREETRAALTDVKLSANEIAPYSMEEIEGVALVSPPGTEFLRLHASTAGERLAGNAGRKPEIVSIRAYRKR